MASGPRRVVLTSRCPRNLPLTLRGHGETIDRKAPHAVEKPMRSTLLFALVASGVLAVGTMSNAGVDPHGEAEANLVPAVEALAVGEAEPGVVEMYMERYAVDAPTARRNVAAQNGLLDLGSEAAVVAGERFSSTWLYHGETPRLEVRLTAGEPEPALERTIMSMSPLLDVTYGVDEQADDRLGTVAVALDHYAPAGIDIGGIGIDGSTGRVVVDIYSQVAVDDGGLDPVSTTGDWLVSVTGIAESDLVVDLSVEPFGDHT